MVPPLDFMADVRAKLSSFKPSLGLYVETLNLIREVENRLAKADARKWIPESILRSAVVPSFLLLRGGGQLLSGFGVVFRSVFVVVVVGSMLLQFLPQGLQAHVVWVLLFVVVALVLAYMFAAPSTYCISGVNQKHVATVTNYLSMLKLDNEKMLEPIARNIEVFEGRIKRRLVGYRWAIAAGWGIFFAPTIAKLGGIGAVPSASTPTLAELAPYLAWFLLCFFLVDAYGRGVDILFRAIELGCNEHKASLLRRTASKNAQ